MQVVKSKDSLRAGAKINNWTNRDAQLRQSHCTIVWYDIMWCDTHSNTKMSSFCQTRNSNISTLNSIFKKGLQNNPVFWYLYDWFWESPLFGTLAVTVRVRIKEKIKLRRAVMKKVVVGVLIILNVLTGLTDWTGLTIWHVQMVDISEKCYTFFERSFKSSKNRILTRTIVHMGEKARLYSH